jgi:hypothetical protein
MSKPTALLHWADSPITLRTEPSEPTKNAGFSVLRKLPAQYFNWLFGVTGDIWTWLNVRLFDAYTLASLGNPDVRLYGDDIQGLQVKKASGAFHNVLCDELIADGTAECADPDLAFGPNTPMVPNLNWHGKNTCVAAVTTSQAKANGEYITWGFTAHDPSGILDISGSQKFTIPTGSATTALWEICLTAAFTNHDNVEVDLIKNASSGVKGMLGTALGLDGTQAVTITGIVGGAGDPLTAGDYFRFKISCGVGGVTLLEARTTFKRIA